nr:methyltransferase domain-containing protein [Hyalangium versicolor]
MVEARERFLSSGHYAPLAQLLAELAAASVGPAAEDSCILEVGAGTGYYLARVLDRCPGARGLAVDISKFAARRAARAHARIGAIVADGENSFPLRSGTVTLALSVFAPRNADELHRVLKPRGALLVATPTSRHLQELTEPLGLLHVDECKAERLSSRLAPYFHPSGQHALELKLLLSRMEITLLVSMGPNAFHIDPVELQRRIAHVAEPIEVTASFTLSVHRPK